MKFNQPNLEGGLDLSIHEEDVGPVRIHVQNLVVIPDNDNAIMDFRFQGSKAGGNARNSLVIQCCRRKDPGSAWEAGCEEFTILRAITTPEVAPPLSLVHNL